MSNIKVFIKAGTRYRVETEGERLGKYRKVLKDAPCEIVMLSMNDDPDSCNLYQVDGELVFVRNRDEL